MIQQSEFANKLKYDFLNQGKISLDELPDSLITDEARYVWNQLVLERQSKLEIYRNLVFDSYINGLKLFNYTSETIPTLSQANQILQASGWQCVWNMGLSEDEFFTLTACKIFPIASYCRKTHELSRSVYPDFVHDFWGHLPLLFDPEITNLITTTSNLFINHKYSEADREINQVISKNAKDYIKSNYYEDSNCEFSYKSIGIKKLISRLFLFTVEFGLLGNNQKFKIFGGGILSSTLELNNLFSGNASTQRLNYDAILSNEYVLHNKQKTYFYIPTFACVNGILDQIIMSGK